MKISRMTKGSWGKIVAFFDLETDEGLVVKGFKMIQGNDGYFVGFPSEKKGDEYKNTVYADKQLKQTIEHLAHNEYHYEEANQQQPANVYPDGGTDEVPF